MNIPKTIFCDIDETLQNKDDDICIFMGSSNYVKELNFNNSLVKIIQI